MLVVRLLPSLSSCPSCVRLQRWECAHLETGMLDDDDDVCAYMN